MSNLHFVSCFLGHWLLFVSCSLEFGSFLSLASCLLVIGYCLYLVPWSLVLSCPLKAIELVYNIRYTQLYKPIILGGGK
jgi:hypothetical protein